MSSSCRKLREEMVQCILASECIEVHQKPFKECLQRENDPYVPAECRNLQRAFFECKREMVRGSIRIDRAAAAPPAPPPAPSNAPQGPASSAATAAAAAQGTNAVPALRRARPKDIKLSDLPLPPDVLIDSKHNRTYYRHELLGTGGFARCYRVTDDNGCELAAKVVARVCLRTNKHVQKLSHEIRIHRKMSHANIVKYFHYFEDGTNVYIILELCSNKSLNDMVRARKRLTEPEARFYIAELLSALDYMHGQNIIHRDLKLGNLFLNDTMHLKVGDFGLATELTSEDERKKTICGTPNYIAPEILNSALGHSFEVDIWATGIILYTMLVGRPPFQTKDVDRIYAKIKEVSYEFPESVRISNEARDLIAAILQSQPETRPSIQQIRFHPFFTAPMPNELPVSALTTTPVWSASVSGAARNDTDPPRAARANSAADVPARAATAPQLRHPWSVTVGPSSSSNAAAAAASEASARRRIEAAREQALADRQQQQQQQQHQAASTRPEPPQLAPTAPSSLDPPAPAPPSAPSTWSRSTAVHASSDAHDHERAASPTLVAGPAAAATAVGTTARTLRRARSEQWLPSASTNAAAAAVAPAAEATMRQSTVARSASTTTTASASDMSPRTTARVVTAPTRANSTAAPLASSSATYYPDDTVVPTRPSPSSRAAIAATTDSRRRAAPDLAASRSGSHHSGSSSSTISSMSSTAPDHPPPPAAMADLARDEYSARAMRMRSPRADLDPVRRDLATPVTAAAVAAQSQRMMALSLDSPGRVRAREVARDEAGSGERTAAKLRSAAAAAAGRGSPAMTRSVQGASPAPAPAVRGYDRDYDLRRDVYDAAPPARASPQSMAVDRAMSYDVQDLHRLTRSTSVQVRSNSSPVVGPSSSSAAAAARAARYASDDRLAAYLPPSPRTRARDAKDEYRTSPLGHEVPRCYDAPRTSYEAAPISHEAPRSYEPPRTSDRREPDPTARDKYRAMAYDRVPPPAPVPVPARADAYDVDYERARNEAYGREYNRAGNEAYDREFERATNEVYDREYDRVGAQVYDQYERTRPEPSSASAAAAREHDRVRPETAPREYERSRPDPVASREYERARPETSPREYDRDRTRHRDDEYSRSAVVPPVHESIVVADRASSSAASINARSSPMSAPMSAPTRANDMASATAAPAPASAPPPAAAPVASGSGGPHMMDTMARNLALAWQCAHDTSALATIRLEALRVGADVPPPTVFIVKFIDYSNKYGLGYQLSNGVVGVYFNDTTLLVLAPDGHHFEYLYSCRTDSSMPGVMKRQAHTMTQYPPDLAKKVTLLHHFREYMNQNMAQGAAPSVPSTPTTTGCGDTAKTADLEFLIKYYKTAAAVVFRLSNQVVQVNFQDHTKMVLANDARLVAYIDQYRQVHQFQLADLPALRARASLASVSPAAWPPGTDAKEVHMAEALLQRLRYTKDLVDNMRTKRRRQQQQQQQQQQSVQ
ncbi:Cell cycle serine/threonine-protein kinase cdc5/MSD2 [Allomyces javanicus]|nr:Cell cycle serine/threonine-protein kinase cdc5/MSD2 [Allomyces javanicus]